MTRSSGLKVIASAAAIAGALDLTYALAWSAAHGTPPIKVLQFVASGLLGNTAANGGWGSAAIGIIAHFAIMTIAAALFYLASRRFALLNKRPVVSGVLFGIGFYLTMNYLVTPLSMIGRPVYVGTESMVRNLFAHVLLSGLPIAFATRKLSRVSGTVILGAGSISH